MHLKQCHISLSLHVKLYIIAIPKWLAVLSGVFSLPELFLLMALPILLGLALRKRDFK